MPRQARLDAAGTLHHVMARGIEQCLIFRDDRRDDRDREDFIGRMSELVKQSKTGTHPIFFLISNPKAH
ncbi:MAG: hypothetical protein HZC48_00600 [Nitrospirae bacterium]|nr:hypothetical protein [Nitrospirota bacterium]